MVKTVFESFLVCSRVEARRCLKPTRGASRRWAEVVLVQPVLIQLVPGNSSSSLDMGQMQRSRSLEVTPTPSTSAAGKQRATLLSLCLRALVFSLDDSLFQLELLLHRCPSAHRVDSSVLLKQAVRLTRSLRTSAQAAAWLGLRPAGVPAPRLPAQRRTSPSHGAALALLR